MSDASNTGWLAPGWSFTQVPKEAMIGKYAVKPRAFMVLAYLAWRAGPDGHAWPGVDAIARDLNIKSPNTIRNALDELQAKGWLLVQPRYREDGGQSTNDYALHNPSVDHAGADTPLQKTEGGGPSKNCTPPLQKTEGAPPSKNCTQNNKYNKNDKHTNDSQSPKQDVVGSKEDFNTTLTRGGRQGVPEPLPDESEKIQKQDGQPHTFQEWRKLILEGTDRTGKRNPVAGLHRMFVTLFPDHEEPDYALLGRAARQVGGAGRFAELMWYASARPPTGDVLPYVMGMARKRRGNGKGERGNGRGDSIFNGIEARGAGYYAHVGEDDG